MTGEKKGSKEKERKTCDYKMHNGKSCGRKLYDDEHCIFHSKDIKGKKEKFDDEFWEEFERQKEYEENYDFTGFVFPGDFSFNGKEFEKNVDFMNAQFSGEVDFKRAQFSGKADFWSAQFLGMAYFTFAKFNQEAYFRCAQFSEASFMDAEFLRETYFENAQFSGDTNFTYTQFSVKADFFRSRFSGEAYLRDAQFLGEADFRDAQFSGETYFSYVKFSGRADFRESQFSGEVDFWSAQFSGEVDFERAQFSGKILHELFSSLRNRGIKRILKGRYKINDFKFHLGEKIAKVYPVIDRMTKDAWYLDDFKANYPVIYGIWWLFADCGRSFLRWALWSLIFAEAFAIIFGLFYYYNPISFKSEVISFSWPGISLLYYSVVTFTTLGFGGIVPKIPILQIIVMLEVILGYIMLGGLISILANKLAQRS
jgi:uncharacterized protein YjbI with pentapeptide repeats